MHSLDDNDISLDHDESDYATGVMLGVLFVSFILALISGIVLFFATVFLVRTIIDHPSVGYILLLTAAFTIVYYEGFRKD